MHEHRLLNEAEADATTPLKAAIAHEHAYYMSKGVVVRKDNYRLVNVVSLLYVYVMGSCLLRAARDSIFNPFCWNLGTNVIKYDLKDPVVVLLARTGHVWLVTSCVI